MSDTSSTNNQYQCSVCSGKIKIKSDKVIACQNCNDQIKKSTRQEIERESPTKRFLMKYASNLSSQLPTALVQDAMRRARGYTGGSVTMADMSKSQPDSSDTHIDTILTSFDNDDLNTSDTDDCQLDDPPEGIPDGEDDVY